MFSLHQHAGIFGRGYVEYFTKTPILTIGKDSWTRQEIVAMGITQTVACGNLSKITKQLGVLNTKDLFERTSPYSFTEFRAGVATLYVLFAVFAEKGLDPTQWYQGKSESQILVTFESLKHREAQARARERADERKRARSKRARTHQRAVSTILNGART